MNSEYDSYSLESDLDIVDALEEVVYKRIRRAVASIDSSRPTIEDILAGTAIHSEQSYTEEARILRECAHSVVLAALVALRGVFE